MPLRDIEFDEKIVSEESAGLSGVKSVTFPSILVKAISFSIGLPPASLI